jgi:hypothetical protein
MCSDHMKICNTWYIKNHVALESHCSRGSFNPTMEWSTHSVHSIFASAVSSSCLASSNSLTKDTKAVADGLLRSLANCVCWRIFVSVKRHTFYSNFKSSRPIVSTAMSLLDILILLTYSMKLKYCLFGVVWCHGGSFETMWITWQSVNGHQVLTGAQGISTASTASTTLCSW